MARTRIVWSALSGAPPPQAYTVVSNEDGVKVRMAPKKGMGWAVVVLVCSIVILLVQFLSASPYWLLNKEDEVYKGPWYKLVQNNTIGLVDFEPGSEIENMLGAGAACLFIFLLSVFSVASLGVVIQRWNRPNMARMTRRHAEMCCSCIHISLLLLAVTLLQFFVWIVVLASTVNEYNRLNPSGSTNKTEFGPTFWVYTFVTLAFVLLKIAFCVKLYSVRQSRERASGEQDVPSESMEMRNLGDSKMEKNKSITEFLGNFF